MPQIRLQPKQWAIREKLRNSRASWIGMWGGRGCAKSFTIDALLIELCIARPGIVVCVVMRNYDQVFKYHIEPILRNWPELAESTRRGMPSSTRFPNGSQLDYSYAESLEDVERRFRSANYGVIAIDQAEQFTESELREMRKACRTGSSKMLLSFNMGGASIQTLRKWFDTHEVSDPGDYDGLHFYPWDNVVWALDALSEDGLTEGDYYSWSHEERMEYCATRTAYGKALSSEDDAYRNRDWLGSWDSLEGAYFGRVFERSQTLINHQQFQRLVRPWDKRWLSQDWGKSHYNVTYWHAKVAITPELAFDALDWQIAAPINACITYREMIVSEMSSPDVGAEIVMKTPEAERKHIRSFHLSPDAFANRDSVQTTAMELGKALKRCGMVEPIPADNDRAGGHTLMYQLLQGTKRRGANGDVWLITAECPHLLDSLPLAMRDPKNLDDVVKTDKSQARLEQDCLDAARYGVKAEMRPRLDVPAEVRRQELFEQFTGNPTMQNIAMQKFKQQEHNRVTVGRGFRVR